MCYMHTTTRGNQSGSQRGQRALADTLVGVAFIDFCSYNSVSRLEAADRQQMVEAHTETQVAEVLQLKE